VKRPPKRIWVVIDTDPVGKWPDDSGLPQGRPAHTEEDLRYRNPELTSDSVYPEMVAVPYVIDPQWRMPKRSDG
jgi:hypothetical protein